MAGKLLKTKVLITIPMLLFIICTRDFFGRHSYSGIFHCENLNVSMVLHLLKLNELDETRCLYFCTICR